MAPLPDETLVVRGGQCLPENFIRGSATLQGDDGTLEAISVNAAAGRTIEELTAPNAQTGYPGIPNRQIGVTTVGKIRAAGGNLICAPSSSNPYHALMSGLTAEQAGQLFRPTRRNPNRCRTG